MSRRPFMIIAVLLFFLAACHERSGVCPSVDNVQPDSAYASELVTVTGSSFSLDYQDLWGDDPVAVPPEVFLDVSFLDSIPSELEAMFSPEELAAMSAMSMSLPASQVFFESDEQLTVELPDLTWSDLESAAEMYGATLPDISAFLDEFPLVSTLRVQNPSGCSGSWEQPFSLIVLVDGGGA